MFFIKKEEKKGHQKWKLSTDRRKESRKRLGPLMEAHPTPPREGVPSWSEGSQFLGSEWLRQSSSHRTETEREVELQNSTKVSVGLLFRYWLGPMSKSPQENKLTLGSLRLHASYLYPEEAG